ncbi:MULTISPECIES: FtsX-like permease family protein [unclassified Lentimicrobium]|uniref:FtsX-like permease family protein n=1 Tax=unclassified Lentimicrobium TaxID=2677434 RepID=UPI001553236D|nr:MULTISPECIES: FtsX-like permease family protein [unclassified Lentimicrobium]NPD46621.1 FtsX-like permease family protein [Lentimicrobium sp. S6]NPD84742.1 FtsX-like permease family protein [Lentimicrobium sp. L6]
MIKNYIKIAFANLWKNKVYSSISILSLTIGLAVSILLLFYVLHEWSFDRYHTKADSIHRLCQEQHPYQAPGTAALLTEKLPAIKSFARILPRDNILIQKSELRFKENLVAWVDPDLFNIFSFQFVRGDAATALTQPWSMVITEETALKYFGDADPIGKTLKVSSEYDYTITGVIQDIPENSHFTFDIFMTLNDGNAMFDDGWEENWGWWNFLVYFDTQQGFNKADVEAEISKLMKDYYQEADALPIFTLQNLKDIHLFSSHFLGDIQPQNSVTYVIIFLAIALLILLIASFNYVNLLTANATKRLTEIGVRKSFGASRKQLATQFIMESILVFLISFGLALLLVKLSLPLFNNLADKQLTFSILTNGTVILGMTIMMFTLGILAGWYPAFVLSSYQPQRVMKSNNSGGRSGFQIKRVLIGTQFTIVIILIVSAIVMFRQISFLQNKDLGFEKDGVLTAIFDFGDETKYNTLKQALLKNNDVISVAVASRIPSGSLNNDGTVLPEGQTDPITIPYVHVTFDYFKTLGIEAAQGRLFSEETKTDQMEAIVLNQAAVEKLGITENPLGQSLECVWPNASRRVIGVIDDFHFESLYNNIKPAVFVIHYPWAYHLIVKVKPTHDVSAIKSSLSGVCHQIYPNEIIEFSFLDEILEQRYMRDNKTFQLMGFFAILAILLASMGLFGIVSFMMASRTKEIGIRKVNGATVFQVLKLLNLGFLKWVLVSFVIGIPIAYYGLNIWLTHFAFKTALSWWIFLLAGGLSFIIVLLTVSGQTFKAARQNPIDALRYE